MQYHIKIITKIIANRIKPFLNLLISQEHASFLRNRRASDNSIIIQEIIRKLNTSKGKPSFVLKIDLEKAFDKLERPFIYRTLKFFKFPPNISSLILNCITTSNILILVNGIKSKTFYPSRGIRLGDPMSPYLFILCIDMLSKTINNHVDTRRWDPVKINHNSPYLSHIIFTDDLTLMGKANNKIMLTIQQCLDNFCTLSGHNINKNKWKILVSKNCHPQIKNTLTNFFDINISNSFEMYLGFPITHSKPKAKDYHFLIDRMRFKLNIWNAKWLSMAGRSTLAASTLSQTI